MKIQGRHLLLTAGLLIPALMLADPVTVTINDLGEGAPLFSVSGFDTTSLVVQPNTESFDLHGEFLSTLSTLANGAVLAANFNLTEPAAESPAGTSLTSDTLNVVFTGHTPTTGDANNVSVDLHFRSDGDSPAGVPPLVNAVSLAETGSFQDLTSLISQLGGPGDFNISVASDVAPAVPEPSQRGILVLGMVALLIYGRRVGVKI